MNNIIALTEKKHEARVDSRVLAEHLQNQHKNVLALLDKYRSNFEELGIFAFETRKSKRGLPERFALLNEDQSYLLLTFSGNTKHIVGLKVELVKAFSRFRRHQQSEADYLPFYHELHDQVKALADRAHQCGSNAPERVFHININKLINEAFGLKSGQRPNLPGHMRAKVTAANVIAKELLEEAIARGYDHKAAHLHVKQGIQTFANAGVRRMKAVFVACVDGLTGFPEAIATVFPRTQVQLCIVHMMRNSLAFVSWKDRKAVAAGLKVIYQSITVTEAEQELEAFALQWDKQYPSISASWRKHWVNLIAFFDYPDEIRKVIYTTNAIESLNSVIRKATERRKLFPTDQSAMKVVYLAIEQAARKWSMPIRDWKPALNQFMILYEDRFPEIF